jgi:hypothetical protein
VPTIKREYAVANEGVIPATYTNTGTVRIEPPPPIKPNEMPIKSAKIRTKMLITNYF